MSILCALFDDYTDASRAIRELHAAGIPNADLSLVTADQSAGEPAKPSKIAADVASGTEAGAGAGVVLGGAGGLLAGLGLLAVPGIGPVIAGGWLLATAAGAAGDSALGAIAGGIVGALVAGGVEEKDAHVYAEGLRRGGSLVTVKLDDAHLNQAKAILEDNDCIDAGERRNAYQREGWTGFDPATDPLITTKQSPRESAARPTI